MPHWRLMTEKDTLGVWDLAGPDGKPRDVTTEIVRVEAKKVVSQEKPKGELRPFVYFKGTRKALVCNATNAKTISSIAGSEDTDKWIGVRVTLFSTMVKAKGGQPTPGIRIRPMRGTGPVEELGEGNPVDEDVRAEQRAAHGDDGGADAR